MTTELWRELGERTSRPIKVALLDQSLVAGIGNLYASEILHLAGVHPETRTDRNFGGDGGSGLVRRVARFWNWRSGTKDRRWGTGRIATH